MALKQKTPCALCHVCFCMAPLWVLYNRSLTRTAFLQSCTVVGRPISLSGCETEAFAVALEDVRLKMEYVPGTSLGKHMDGRPRKPNIARARAQTMVGLPWCPTEREQSRTCREVRNMWGIFASIFEKSAAPRAVWYLDQRTRLVLPLQVCSPLRL